MRKKDKLLRITKNLASESSNINPRPVVFLGNSARNACLYFLMTIGGFYKCTKLSHSTLLGEYRVSNLYFFPQEGGRLEFIIGLGFAKARLRLILGR